MIERSLELPLAIVFWKLRMRALRQYVKMCSSGVPNQLQDQLLTALTILLMIVMFVLAPLHAAGVIKSQGYGFAGVAVVTGGVLLISGSLIAVSAMLLGIGLAAAATLLGLQKHSILDVHLNAIAWTIMGFALSWVVARAVFAPGRVTYHRIIGAVLLYLSMGVVFVGVFAFVALVAPGAISGLQMEDDATLASKLIYFSFGTPTTVGSGDMVPVHPFARSLSIIEAMIGQLYPATLLARLVTLEIEGSR